MRITDFRHKSENYQAHYFALSSCSCMTFLKPEDVVSLREFESSRLKLGIFCEQICLMSAHLSSLILLDRYVMYGKKGERNNQIDFLM